MSSACNRRRHWPELDCVGRVNGTFCFTGASNRAQLLKSRLVLNPGFLFFLQKHFFGQFSLFFFLRASNHQLVDKMNYIEFKLIFSAPDKRTRSFHIWIQTNPVKAFNGTCVRLTSITFPVIWSSVLIQ